jgi:hypothetical protein
MSAMEAVGGCSAYPASEAFHPAPHTSDRATARPRCLPMAGRFTGQAWWVPVVRHARCTDDSCDSEQRFPVSVQLGKARQEKAATIAACTICPVRAQARRGCSGTGMPASTRSVRPAGVIADLIADDLAGVMAATGAGAGLAGASQIARRS